MTTYTLSIVVEGKDQASGPLGRVGSALSNMSQIVGGILGAQLITMLGQGLLSLGKNALQATAQMQAFEMGLSTLIARELRMADSTLTLNNALTQASPLAGKLADELRQIAIVSPYELGTVQDTFRLGMAFGFTSSEAKKLTNGILNMAAGVGASNEMLGRMSYNFAQIRMQGKVTALDIRQLAMAGFDLVGALQGIGKEFGVAIETHEDFNRAIASGELTWEQFATGFEKYADQNFGGAAERMSRTLMGLQSTFKDVFLLTMPKIFGPAAEIVTGSLNEMLNSFMAFSESGALEQMGKDFAEFLDSPFFKNGFMGLTRGFEHWAQNVDWAQATQDLITGAKSIDWEAVSSALSEGAGNIANGFYEIFKNIDWSLIATSIGESLSQIDVLAEIISLFENASGPISDFFGTLSTELMPALQTIGAALVAFWQTIKPSLVSLWETFKTQLPDGFNSLSEMLPLVTAVIVSALSIIAAVITGAVNAIVWSMETWMQASAVLRESLSNIFSGLYEWWSGLFNIIKGLFTDNATLVSDGFGQLLDGVATTVVGLLQLIAAAFTATFGQLLAVVVGFVTGVIGFFQNLYDVLVGHSIIPDLMTKMKSVVTDGLAKMFEVFSSAVNGIVNAVDTWLPAIESKLIQLKEIFKTQFSQMINAAINIILEFGKTLVDALRNLLNQLQSLIKPISINIALPDFALLAAQAAAGMAMLNAALSGGTTGNKGKPPRPEVNTAGGAGGGSTIGFSEGGVATGPRSGYQVTLHGTEAVIPLSGGRTVPVEFNGALNALRGEMQTMNGTGGNSGAGSPITIIVNGANDPEAVAKEIFGLLKAQGVLA